MGFVRRDECRRRIEPGGGPCDSAFVQDFLGAAEVPDEAVFGRMPGRTTPHPYRESEIVELLAATRQIGPEGSLRPAVMETLFGLIACTGLRISEAQVLLDADFDLHARRADDPAYQVRQDTAGSAASHLSGSTDAPPNTAQPSCARHCATTELPFFVTSRGQLLGHALGDRQVHGVVSDLRDQLGWVDRGAMARRASMTCATASQCAGVL